MSSRDLDLLRVCAAMVFGFEGLRITLLSSYHSRILGIAMLLAGFLLFRKKIPREKKGRRKLWFLPLLGVLIILADLSYNMLSAGVLDLRGMDQMTILFGLTLILYNTLSKRYGREVRFAALFFGVFTLVLITPILLFQTATLLTGGLVTQNAAAGWYTENFLGRPMSFLLELIGINTTLDGNLLVISMPYRIMPVYIGISCSGAYSFAVFASAFTAYVFTRYRRITRKVLTLLLFGVTMTYIANLIRMYITILVGYYYGTNALLFTHNNLGWLIFMFWVLIFWYLGFKIFMKDVEED